MEARPRWRCGGPRGPAVARRPARSAWRGLLAVLVLACGGDGSHGATLLEPLHRFVPGTPDGTPFTASLPTACILDDTRFVLAAPPSETLVWPRQLAVKAGQSSVKLKPGLPPALRGARRIVVHARVRVGKRTTKPQPLLVETQGRGGLARASFEVPLPARSAGREASVSARAYAADLVDLASIRTPAVEVPPGALLEFAIGLIDPEWFGAPVEFRVNACLGEDCSELFSERFDPAGKQGAGWRNRRVSLSQLEGERVSFRFEARPLEAAARPSFPVWANPTLYAPKPRPEGEPNVILLSIDTLRADHLGTYGYRYDTAPFMQERFGRGGSVFENLVAAATTTNPAHASIFTALQPTTHGALDGMRVMARDIATLPERIRAAGIDTAAFTEDGWLSVTQGFGRGFDRFRENRSARIMTPVGQVDLTFAQARSWLEENHDKRFFLFLHTYQVHSPYTPPERYRDLFGEYEGRAIDESSPAWVRARANYDREIRYTDDELRQLFQTIDALGLDRNTVFILTSDHGEAFLEHGLLEHGGRLYEEVVHVPLMLAGPGVPHGRRVATPVGHVDLMPTILELLGVPVPAHLEGTSLVGVLRDPAREVELASRSLYSETRSKKAITQGWRPVRFPVPAFMVRRGARKLARYPTADDGVRYEFYDLSSDPEETRDLYPDHAAEAADLRQLLDSYEQRGSQLRSQIEAGTGNRGDQPEALLDPDQEEKLRALGYLD